MRLLVIALLLANLGYFGWSRGTFAPMGFEPARHAESEPQRLRNQLRPDALQIRRPGAPAGNAPPAEPATAGSDGAAPPTTP